MLPFKRKHHRKILRIVVHDSFNRADSGSLGKADTGQTWVTTNAWGIKSNQAYHTLTTDGVATVDTGVVKCSCEADITYGGDDNAGIAFRSDGTTNNRWIFFKASSSLLLRKVISGTSTTLGTVNLTWATGQTYKFKVICNGSDIQCYLDGVLQFQVTDSSLIANTKAGLMAYSYGSTSSSTFDNFVVGGI